MENNLLKLLGFGPGAGNERLKIKGRVTFVLESRDGKSKQIIETDNIVTNAGDTHYAQRAGGETPTNAFQTGRMVLGTSGNAPGKGSLYSDITSVVSGSVKAFDATYPKSNDNDTDNTGANVDSLTYRTSYLTSEANAVSIDRIAITVASPSGGSPLLMYAVVTPFTKTSNDTLKVFVNHNFNGI